MDKLLLLGGKPIASCDIINYANSLGVYTVTTDYLPKESSPAKRISDEAWDISTSEVDKLCQAIKQNEITAVFTGVHEFNILKNIEICERLGLTVYTSFDVWNKLSNKDIYKEIFFNAGLPKVKEFHKGSYKNVRYKDIVYPTVVKPVDGSSGFGVKKCYSEKELRNNAYLAGQVAKNGNILVEECIEAPEVTIFYVVQDGNIYLTAMGDRITHSFDDNVIPLPNLYTFPSKHLDTYISRFNKKVITAFTEAGVKNGMIFIQAFWRNEECHIYDIGFRLTGTQEYNLLSEICGFNPLEMMVDFALTGHMGKECVADKIDPYLRGKKAAIVTHLMYPGIIGEFRGIEDIKRIDGVVKFLLNHEIGETIPETALGTLVQIVARTYIVASSEKELKEKINNVRELFSVIGKNGEVLDIK